MSKSGIYRILLVVMVLIGLPGCAAVAIPQSSHPQYYFPPPEAQYLSPATTIILRYGPALNAQTLSTISFTVQGSTSGMHAGKTILADDQKTVIFKPDAPFAMGEKVSVEIGGLQLNPITFYDPISYSFTISVQQSSGSPGADAPPPPDQPPASAFPNYLTLPQDIPHYSLVKTSPDAGEGYIFAAPFYWLKSTLGSYLLILDNQGEIVYYQSAAKDQNPFDFKVQPNGLLSYFSITDSGYDLLDSSYHFVDRYTAGNGYATDLHDFQLLPNGDALLMIYDAQSIDMSKLVAGGKPNAVVTGLVIQEMDRSKNVIFEWRSWDHFRLEDTPGDLTSDKIDAVHGNSLALTQDGNLLLSSRNLSEVTKISLKNGAILWRLGGKQSTFKFVNDPQPFGYQHDARELPNGNIMVFDNHGNADVSADAPSRAVEYQLDMTQKTATKVWEFAHNPPIFGTYMGNTQRLANGNTLIDWGAPSTDQGYQYTNITEVSPEGKVVFELAFDQAYVSYRAFRFPWHGQPTTLPDLAFRQDGSILTLGYSWNGATDVASYNLYGGNAPASLAVLDRKAKAGFETQSHLTNLPKGTCYFQAAALDRTGKELARSKIISTDQALCPAVQ